MTTAAKETATLWVHKILMPILMGVVSIVLGVFGWIGSQVLDEFRTWKGSVDRKIETIELAQARSDGNRFTANDWNHARGQLDMDRNNQDRRITRLEEAVPPIKETLLRIENKLDKLQDRQ